MNGTGAKELGTVVGQAGMACLRDVAAEIARVRLEMLMPRTS